MPPNISSKTPSLLPSPRVMTTDDVKDTKNSTVQSGNNLYKQQDEQEFKRRQSQLALSDSTTVNRRNSTMRGDDDTKYEKGTTTATTSNGTAAKVTTDNVNTSNSNINSNTQQHLQNSSTHEQNMMYSGGYNPNSMYGSGMYYGNMSPYGYGGLGMGMGIGMGYGMAGGGPFLSGLNQAVFSFQSLVFSLGQAMQILGMNTEALKQMYNQAMSMFDNILSTIHEMKSLENDTKPKTEEEEKRRRRLKALRWSICIGISYAGYNAISKWLRRRRDYNNYRQRLLNNHHVSFAGGGNYTTESHLGHYSPHHHHGSLLLPSSPHRGDLSNYHHGYSRYDRPYSSNRYLGYPSDGMQYPGAYGGHYNNNYY